MTLPSPSLYANFWTPGVSKESYPTLDDFLEDVAEILCEEVEERKLRTIVETAERVWD